jgi:acyl carrier protein|tara:strand:+ start:538 stop:750 length:213 start_codon:yes stop_codon:yes gene_type:complete
MNEIKQKAINNIIDQALEDEGYESYDEVDSLTSMTIINDIEDKFDINVDLNILEGISGRTELVARLMEAI